MATQPQPPKLSIPKDHHAVFVGATGSGKTTLAAELLRRKRHAIVIDPKHTFDPDDVPDAEVYYDLSELYKHRGPGLAIYRSEWEQMGADSEKIFEWALERENTTIYVDEVIAIAHNPTPPRMYARALQTGRALNVSVWSATQRPARIPINIFTESTHHFVFMLRNADDRKRCSEFTHPKLAEPVYEHDFWYFNGSNEPWRMRLDLGKE